MGRKPIMTNLYTVRFFTSTDDRGGFNVSDPMSKSEAESLCEKMSRSLDDEVSGIQIGFGSPGYYLVQPYNDRSECHD